MKLGLIAVAALAFAAGCVETPPPHAPVAKPKPAPAPVAEAPKTTPDAPFRQQAPTADGKVTFVAPKVEQARLKNGLRVFIVERHDLPIVTVKLLTTAGAGDLPDQRPGTLSFMGQMLERGTKKHSALQLGDELENMGAFHGAGVDWDSGGAHIRMLTEQLDAGLDLLAEIVLTPTFPSDEIERLRTQRITSIQSEKNVPATSANNAMNAALYGRAHPYGHSLTGEEADVKAITRGDLVKAYEKLFTVNNSAIVVAGDINQASLLPKLEARFGAWKAKGKALARKTPAAPTKADTDKRIVFVDRPGAQSQVQVARLGAAYGVKDREAVVVANQILGGSFSSRINMNLREKHAYTYGARSHFQMRHAAGPFVVSGAIVADKTGPAIKEVLSELDGLKKDGPSDEELAMAKESLRLTMPAKFETTGEVANAIGDLVVYDLPLDEYDRRLQRIETVTKDDVKRIANEYFGSESMTVVVVGGKQQIAPQLEPLGLGAVDERDAFGNPLGAVPSEAAKPAKKAKAAKK
jgi:zinc protease